MSGRQKKRDPVEEARAGEITFAQDQETGEVASRAGGWEDVQTMSKAKVRKLVDEYIRATAAEWVEAAGIAEEIDGIVAKRLPSIVEKLIEAKTEKVAAEILEKILARRLTEALKGPLPFTVGVTIKARELHGQDLEIETPPAKKKTRRRKKAKA